MAAPIGPSLADIQARAESILEDVKRVNRLMDEARMAENGELESALAELVAAIQKQRGDDNDDSGPANR